MIDWATFVFPCLHREPINGGHVVSIKPCGEVDWQSSKWADLEGSHDSRISFRTSTRSAEPCTHVEVSGNLSKLFQAHNLWGTDDLFGLILDTINLLVQRFDLTPTDTDRDLWARGLIPLTRVDVTDSFRLGSRSEVLAWLRAAEQTAHLSHRGRGQLTKGTTLYFGKHSRRWSLKLYAKGQEIAAKGHEQSVLARLPHAIAWADPILRAELVLRGMELRRLGLGYLHEWADLEGVPFEPLQLLRDRLGAMTMTTARTLPDDVLDSLTSGQKTAYFAWLSGTDLRAVLSRPTFYRLRAKLLPHGIDVATLQLAPEKSNVVPLVRVLEAVPATIPDWAIGTALYYEPLRRRVVR